ncbi:uncharacterized protein LOC113472823 [Diaphorina citri]|uniref:Uncharacterized protein LOC113472823 n=1 Tax=Diaphorina citri TaxID=121845 RepID=A0A3Q0JJ53_DIACI|nr:uncharacterized protein LOC113472823 [Diaphorina citri]
MNRYIVNSMAAMNVHPQATPAPLPEDTQVPLRALTSPQDLVPLPFHRTIGRNVRLSNDRTIASRRDTEFSQGYVFTGRPVQLGEKIVIQVSKTRKKHIDITYQRKKYIFTVSTHLSPEELSSPINNNSNIDLMNRYIVNSMAAMNVHPQATPAPLPEDTQVPLRALTSPQDLVPLPFHRTIGRNVRLSNDRTIASRRDTEFSQGYVFTGRPVQLGEKIVIQVLETESRYYGALALGLTSCNPASIKDCSRDRVLETESRYYGALALGLTSCNPA